MMREATAGPPPTIGAPQITDSVTQANMTTLGTGPATALVQTFLSQAQAQGILFANMVNEQQQLCVTGHATTVQSVMRILSIQPGRGGKAAPAAPDYTGALTRIAGSLSDIDTKLQAQQSRLNQVSEKVDQNQQTLGVS